jgi:hypothetical protein
MNQRWQGKGDAVFDALIDPPQLVIVLLVIAMVVAAARWSMKLAPGEADDAPTEETEDRPTAGDA